MTDPATIRALNRRRRHLVGPGFAPIDPTAVPGLVGWYDAAELDAADGDRVSLPNSHSAGGGPDFGAPPTAHDLPIYREAPAGFGGAPALEFAGSEYLYSSNTFPDDAQGEIISVVSYKSFGSTLFGAAHEGQGEWLVQQALSGGVVRFRNETTGTDDIVDTGGALALNTTHIINLSSDGSRWAIAVDDQAQSLTVGSGSNRGDWFSDRSDQNSTIGGFFGNGSVGGPSDVFVGIVLVYDHELTSAERDEIVGQLDARYGIL